MSSKKGKKDMELVTAALQGSEDAWSEIYAANATRIKGVLYQLTRGDQSAAEDLVQDTFVKVFQKLGTYKGKSSLSTWIYRVAVNTGLMFLRKQKRRPPNISIDEERSGRFAETHSPNHTFAASRNVVEHQQDDGRNSLEIAYRDMRLELTPERLTIEREVKELAKGYKTCFLLHDVDGLRHKDIARKTKRSVNNSKSQLCKARRILKKKLES